MEVIVPPKMVSGISKPLQISSPDEIEAERKLAKLFSSSVLAAKSNPVIVQAVRQLGNRFISGYFLSLEAIKQNIEKLLSKK